MGRRITNEFEIRRTEENRSEVEVTKARVQFAGWRSQRDAAVGDDLVACGMLDQPFVEVRVAGNERPRCVVHDTAIGVCCRKCRPGLRMNVFAVYEEEIAEVLVLVLEDSREAVGRARVQIAEAGEKTAAQRKSQFIQRIVRQHPHSS